MITHSQLTVVDTRSLRTKKCCNLGNRRRVDYNQTNSPNQQAQQAIRIDIKEPEGSKHTKSICFGVAKSATDSWFGLFGAPGKDKHRIRTAISATYPEPLLHPKRLNTNSPKSEITKTLNPIDPKPLKP